MKSLRFRRPIIVTRHALLRMQERQISEAELVAIIDTGNALQG